MSRLRRGAVALCRGLGDWPAGDRSAWLLSLESGDEQSYGYAAQSWAPASTRMVIGGYGRWLSWLDETGRLDLSLPPGQRVTHERVSRYVVFLRETTALPTAIARVEQLSKALRVMDPAGTWHELQRLANSMRRELKATVKAANDEDQCNAPTVSPHRRLKLAEWPEQDRAAWTAALQPGDVFDPGGVATRWRSSTQGLIVDGYGHWLGWLTSQDLLVADSTPQDRVTRAVVSRYLDHLSASVAPITAAGRIQQLGDAMRALVPDVDWRWLHRAADRLRVTAEPVRNKRERIRSPAELVALGYKLMERAETGDFDQPRLCAALFRDGLLIAFLAQRPIRRKNLASMVLGQHVRRVGDEWLVAFAAAEMKAGRPMEFSFPTELVPALKTYLDVYRPILAGRGCHGATSSGRELWMSAHGTPMGASGIAHQIAVHTRDAFGAALRPHLFRDCTATSIAIAVPEQVTLVRRLLGHATLATSERHYNLATSLDASRRYGDMIRQLRQHRLDHQR